MNGICMAIFLGVFVTISHGFIASHASTKSCEFPHKGDGGVLNQDQGYIDGSALVWVDVASNLMSFVTDPKGIDALTSWIDSTYALQTAMKNGDGEESLKIMNRSHDCIKTVAPFINKPELSEYFTKIKEEFEDLLKIKNLKDINAYMISVYRQLKEKLGCQRDGTVSIIL